MRPLKIGHFIIIIRKTRHDARQLESNFVFVFRQFFCQIPKTKRIICLMNYLFSVLFSGGRIFLKRARFP